MNNPIQSLTILILYIFTASVLGCSVNPIDTSEYEHSKYIQSMHEHYNTKPGSFEEEIIYADKIIELLEGYKSEAGEYPYGLDYLDLSTIQAPALMRQPEDFTMWNRWLGYYRVTSNRYILCIEEKYMLQYVSIMYSAADSEWSESDCSKYHVKVLPQTGGKEHNAVITNKMQLKSKATRYTVKFEDGAMLDIVSKWPDYSVGECVRVFIQEELPPRIASGGNCW
jgi:hypothetical protein